MVSFRCYTGEGGSWVVVERMSESRVTVVVEGRGVCLLGIVGLRTFLLSAKEMIISMTSRLRTLCRLCTRSLTSVARPVPGQSCQLLLLLSHRLPRLIAP